MQIIRPPAAMLSLQVSSKNLEAFLFHSLNVNIGVVVYPLTIVASYDIIIVGTYDYGRARL